MEKSLCLGLYIIVAGIVSLMIGRGMGPKWGLIVFSLCFTIFLFLVNFIAGCFSTVFLLLILIVAVMHKS